MSTPFDSFDNAMGADLDNASAAHQEHTAEGDLVIGSGPAGAGAGHAASRGSRLRFDTAYLGLTQDDQGLPKQSPTCSGDPAIGRARVRLPIRSLPCPHRTTLPRIWHRRSPDRTSHTLNSTQTWRT
jgi:hypothetical protein